MYNCSAPTSRSLDVAGTDTANVSRYDDPDARLRLNAKGQPVAIRRVVSLGRPGSFATQRYQAIKPDEVVGLSRSSLKAWEEKRAHPVN